MESNVKKKPMLPQDATSQCQRLLKRLQKGPATTLQIRHELDILGAGPRIWDLRHTYGYNIQTLWTQGDNPGGSRHYIAQYVLMSGTYRGASNAQR